jgi:hypothetical protein
MGNRTALLPLKPERPMASPPDQRAEAYEKVERARPYAPRPFALRPYRRPLCPRFEGTGPWAIDGLR